MNSYHHVNKNDIYSAPRKQIKEMTRTEQWEENVIDWVTFYRRNLHRFASHYLNIELHLYQILLMCLMGMFPLVVIVACRAAAKSFIIAVFACCRCILYPNSKIVIASATKKQASLIVSEKIKKELMVFSPNLRREIKEIRTGQNETEVIFHNGSSIIVVPANDNARGVRATMLIYEEFRMIKKEIIDTVLSPFLFVRQAPYLKKEEYSHLGEEPIECYISSAFFASHWMSRMIKLSVIEMLNKRSAVFMAFDYAITLKHNIRTRKQLEKEKKKLGAMAFAMEYENVMVGQGEDAFYPFDLLDKSQTLQKCIYPHNWVDFEGSKKTSKNQIKKQKGEYRILSVDIAMVDKANNDNTILTLIRALPNGNVYERQVPYIEGFKGKNTDSQACRIKELFHDLDCDFIVLDTQNAGLAVFDALGRVTYSQDRDVEYPAFTCFNDKDVANRIKNKDALPVVFSFKGQSTINQQMHFDMRDAVKNGLLKLLVNSSKAKDYLETKDFYLKTVDPELIAKYELPYNQTDILVHEMVSLMQYVKKNCLALYEPSTGTKDRYISLAMGNYFIKNVLERELQGLDDEEESWDDMPRCVAEFNVEQFYKMI